MVRQQEALNLLRPHELAKYNASNQRDYGTAGGRRDFESGVNLLERLTGLDIDRDGDVESQAKRAHGLPPRLLQLWLCGRLPCLRPDPRESQLLPRSTLAIPRPLFKLQKGELHAHQSQPSHAEGGAPQEPRGRHHAAYMGTCPTTTSSLASPPSAASIRSRVVPTTRERVR